MVLLTWHKHALLLEETVHRDTAQLLAVSQFGGSEGKGAVSSRTCSLKISPHKHTDSGYSEKERKARGFVATTSHLMEEGSTSEHHRELARVVGVVEPGLMGDVPRVVAPREANDAVPRLSPDTANTKPFSETQTRGAHPETSTALAENHDTQDYALDANAPAPRGGLQVMEMPMHENAWQLLIQRTANVRCSLGQKGKYC